jgi:hypothetical protein
VPYWIVVAAVGAAAVSVALHFVLRRRRRPVDEPVVSSALPGAVAEAAVPAPAAGSARLLPAPRPHHYAFAHRFLTSIVLDDPRQAYRHFFSPAGAAPLRQMWDFVGSHLESAADLLPASGLRLTWHLLDGARKLVVVSLPEPRAMTEAYFVGLVFERRAAQDWRCTNFYTLELSLDPSIASTCAVLCGWTKEAHMSFGTAVAPDEEAFVRAIKELSGPACVN